MFCSVKHLERFFGHADCIFLLNVYRFANYALSWTAIDEATNARRKILKDWECLKTHGVSDDEISTFTGISRATITGVKHFQAWDSITKSVHTQLYAQLYTKATAKSSVKFLDELQGALGFPIRSIQVDGGAIYEPL